VAATPFSDPTAWLARDVTEILDLLHRAAG
jgi:hypothetical protein